MLFLTYSPTQFESALRPGINTVCNPTTKLNWAAKRLTKLGQRIISLMQQHWLPQTQGFMPAGAYTDTSSF
jgi:hypothetical protein